MTSDTSRTHTNSLFSILSSSFNSFSLSTKQGTNWDDRKHHRSDVHLPRLHTNAQRSSLSLCGKTSLRSLASLLAVVAARARAASGLLLHLDLCLLDIVAHRAGRSAVLAATSTTAVLSTQNDGLDCSQYITYGFIIYWQDYCNTYRGTILIISGIIAILISVTAVSAVTTIS